MVSTMSKASAVETIPAPTPWRSQLYTWARGLVQEYIEKGEGFERGDLVAQGVDHFADKEPFMQALLRSTLDEVLQGIIADVTRSTRSGASRGGLAVGGQVISREHFERIVAKKLSARARVWAKFLENVGGKQVPLLEMTKEELLAAAKQRREQAGIETGYARLWEALAKDLGENERVRDRYDLEAIQRKQDAILEAEVKTGERTGKQQG